MAGALQPFPGRAESASSLIGVLQMTSAALLGIGIGRLLGEEAGLGPWPLAGALLVTGLAASWLAWRGRTMQAA